MSSPPPGPRAKIDRANKHLSDLADTVRGFLQQKPQPIDIIPETQPDGKFIGRLKVCESIPAEIPLILGDGIHNLRSALDILVCDLARYNRTQVTKEHAFPIGDDTHAFKSAFGSKTKGLSKPARKAVKRLQPYQGGNDTLWVLHRLDIADKHKLLLTVAAAGIGIDIGEYAAAGLGRSAREAGMPWVEEIEFPSVYIRSAEIDCYEDGDIVFEYPTQLDNHEKIKYGFDIALKQPGIVECKPVVPLLKELIDFVEGVVHGFDPLFA